MKPLHCLLGVFAILLGGAASAQDAPKIEPGKKVVIPFELTKTQHMAVNVKINGKGPYRLVFDTGAPDSLVSNKIFKEAGLVAKGGGLPLFNSRGNTRIKEIEIGGLKAENVSAMVLDHPTVQAIAAFDGPLDGIIGFTFYGRYRMTIDYEKKEMTFEPGTYEPGDVMQSLLKKLMAPKSARETPRVLAPAGLLGLRLAKEKNDTADGVVVKEVLADSAASRAGFQTGDRLLTLDGRWTDTIEDAYIAAGLIPVGRPIAARVQRGDKQITLKLTVAAGL